jgi:hypothetical protein
MCGMFKNKVYSENPNTEEDLKEAFRIQFQISRLMVNIFATHDTCLQANFQQLC